ncbi:hypothetical protein P7L75_12885 [Tistrella mobilis]
MIISRPASGWPGKQRSIAAASLRPQLAPRAPQGRVAQILAQHHQPVGIAVDVTIALGEPGEQGDRTVRRRRAGGDRLGRGGLQPRPGKIERGPDHRRLAAEALDQGGAGKSGFRRHRCEGDRLRPQPVHQGEGDLQNPVIGQAASAGHVVLPLQISGFHYK